MKKTIFAFDFSMSKPAMCVYVNNEILFYAWPAKIDKKTEDLLNGANINVYNRNIDPINKKQYSSSSLVLEHIKRSVELSNLIINDINNIIYKYNIKKDDVIISSEGLSFASKGDATLNLAAYKQVLLNKLYENGFTNIKTYSPISIKSIAGCSKKNNSNKLSMIDAIKMENFSHKFIQILAIDENKLKKKTAFISTIDDLVDAYWCLKTTIIKEELSGVCI